jgi:hypothetical protein
MTDKIEELVLDLKKDSRFKILQDRRLVGFGGSGGTEYDEHTELESNNLKILYVKEIILGYKYLDEITVTNKIENVYAFCDSTHAERFFKDKLIRKTKFEFNELKEYIDKNA